MDKPHPTDIFFEELLVVLVIYKMEINESPAFNSLTIALQSLNQKTSIFIYDNSPHSHSHTANENWLTTYRNDPSNPGVSKAYNEGFKCAKDQGKKWMLLVDQDTIFEKDFFLKYKIAVEENQNEKIFVPIQHDSKGIVSPFHFHFGRGIRLKKFIAGQYQLAEKKFINSGLLISYELFELSGGFDERFKLDFSDLAFIERLKSVTRTFLVIDSKCTHSLFATECSSREEILVRFKIYCQSANLLGNQTGNFWVLIWKHLRAIVFSFNYFNWRFITLAFAK
jgi:GT2 family glycosyltransferase